MSADFVAAIGEFIGTTMFLFFAFAGTQVGNIGATDVANTTTNGSTGFSPIVLLYVAISFGFSLMVNVWIFFRVSGGLFSTLHPSLVVQGHVEADTSVSFLDPAVTLAMTMTKNISYTRAILLLAMQLVGSIFAAFLVQVIPRSQNPPFPFPSPRTPPDIS